MQWQASDSVQFTADTFYSELESDRNRWWLSFNPTAGLSNARYSDDNILLSGTAAGPVLTNTEFLDTDAEIWSSALRGNFEVTDRFRGSAELAYTESSSTAHQVYFRLQPIVGITPTVNFDFTAGDLGSYQISGVDLSDPAQLRYTILFDNTFVADSEDTAARTDWTYDLEAGFLSGREHQERAMSASIRSRIRCVPISVLPAASRRPRCRLISRCFPIHGFAEGEFAGVPRSYLSASSAVTGCSAFTNVPAVSQDVQCLDPTNNTNAYSSTFEIKERFTEGYTKVDYDTELGSSALTGNVGVRYVRRGSNRSAIRSRPPVARPRVSSSVPMTTGCRRPWRSWS